jgi:glycosyltransferase involved in cell wall biosynthesis
MTTQPSVLILGTYGIPAAHGGFETFAEQLALFLVRLGWHVGVYCQHEVDVVENRIRSETWNGVELIHVEVTTRGSLATLDYDWRCVRDAAKRSGSVCLVLGYNSALFLPYLRMRGRTIITNMDGIEWRRQKWSRPVRAWFWINEWIAAWSSHYLVADHPAIAEHLATRRSRRTTVMIPYGGVPITTAPVDPVEALGLRHDRYLVSIARIEPENNILEIVQAFSRKKRNAKLAVLGKFDDACRYHQAIKAAASDEVVFPGAIYEANTVRALRFHARAYVHGHSVGGTNPSLVEALWAGNAVIAHDNPFNRWTAGSKQFFFDSVKSCDLLISSVFENDFGVLRARAAARAQAVGKFKWTGVLEAYERKLTAAAQAGKVAPALQPARTANQ